MASRMLSTTLRPAASFAVSRHVAVAQRGFSGSTMSLKHKESHSKYQFDSITHSRPKHTCLHHFPYVVTIAKPFPRRTIGDGHDPEKHKNDLLEKHKSGKGHWKPELASDSEEAVKADRTGGKDENITELQKRTKATAEETSKTGTSMHDGL
ncbi:hypothetical protein F5Y19DRAFT_308287 [Xylariaceae sp. FL1651]|nr:hypothetical protein F5Y19DRAFT_308287 [Xylariaceae sp. FL1651]